MGEPGLREVLAAGLSEVGPKRRREASDEVASFSNMEEV